MCRVEPDSSAQREPPNKIDPDGLNENCSLRKLPRSRWSGMESAVCGEEGGPWDLRVRTAAPAVLKQSLRKRRIVFFFPYTDIYSESYFFFFFIEFYIGYIKKALFEFHLKQTTNAGVITLKRVSSGDGGLGEGVLVSTSSSEEEFGT